MYWEFLGFIFYLSVYFRPAALPASAPPPPTPRKPPSPNPTGKWPAAGSLSRVKNRNQDPVPDVAEGPFIFQISLLERAAPAT